MYRWRISIFGKTARSLGTIVAPDDESAAKAKGIEFFHIEPALHFRVVATKLEKVKERAKLGLVRPSSSTGQTPARQSPRHGKQHHGHTNGDKPCDWPACCQLGPKE